MIKKISFLIYVILFGVSCINPVYPSQMFLQHSATLVVGIVLIISLRKDFFSDTSYIMIVILTCLHIIGARYIYSYVPYDEWIKAITGSEFNGHTGFKRNHYDRFVHLAYGSLLYLPAKEVLIKKFKFSAGKSKYVAWAFILCSSMIYELFEWMLTFLLSPEQADNYNGQQGDVWDSQKDMALAMLGVTLVLFIDLVKRKAGKALKN